MSDEADMAADLQQREIDAAIARHASRSRYRLTRCEDCEEPLSPPRRDAGLCVCAVCEAERMGDQ